MTVRKSHKILIPRLEVPVFSDNITLVVAPAPIKVNMSSLMAAIRAAVFWYANAASYAGLSQLSVILLTGCRSDKSQPVF